jgi:hypothetical protein
MSSCMLSKALLAQQGHLSHSLALPTLHANVVETETNMSAGDVVIVTYVIGRYVIVWEKHIGSLVNI